MFLPWVSTCGLLTNPKDTHILKGFSNECQRILCRTVIEFLNLNSHDIKKLLPTPMHIRWVMECLGHSFALTMQDADVILGAITIYEQWLGIDEQPLGKKRVDNRPQCIIPIEQSFIQDIAGHLSMLFTDPVEGQLPKAQLEQHVGLCQRVLHMFVTIGRLRCNGLSAATWEKILRLLVGAADNLLRGNKSPLGNQICGQLVRVLLELYMRSLPVTGSQGELWDLLAYYCKRWVHRKTLIEQWNAATLALTHRLVDTIYGDPMFETTLGNEISISWVDRSSATIGLPDHLTSYAWFRMLHLIGPPSLITNPEVYSAAIDGINRIVFVFTDIGNSSTINPLERWAKVKGALTALPLDTTKTFQRNESFQDSIQIPPAPPDVNTILRLVGVWLFDAALNLAPEYESGRIAAISCLGRLICIYGGGRGKRLLLPHTNRFFLAIRMALRDSNDRVFGTALRSCYGIFSCDSTHTLRGVGALIGDFYHATCRLLEIAPKGNNSNPSSSVFSEDPSATFGGISVILLRRSCIILLNSLLALESTFPESFYSIPMEMAEWKTASSSGIKYLEKNTHLKEEIINQLLKIIKHDTDPINQQMTIWTLCIVIQQQGYKVENSHQNTMVGPIVATICSELVNRQSRWAPPVMFTVLDCLRLISCISKQLRHRHGTAVFNIVSRCCEFINTNIHLVRTTRSPPMYIDALVSAAFTCLQQWIVQAPWILKDENLCYTIIDVVVIGADIRRNNRPLTNGADASIRASSSVLSMFLLKKLGHYPNSAVGPAASSSLLTEKTAFPSLVLDGIAQPNEFARCFMFRKYSILTVIEKVTPLSNESIVILRDPTGRYAWSSKSLLIDPNSTCNNYSSKSGEIETCSFESSPPSQQKEETSPPSQQKEEPSPPSPPSQHAQQQQDQPPSHPQPQQKHSQTYDLPSTDFMEDMYCTDSEKFEVEKLTQKNDPLLDLLTQCSTKLTSWQSFNQQDSRSGSSSSNNNNRSNPSSENTKSGKEKSYEGNTGDVKEQKHSTDRENLFHCLIEAHRNAEIEASIPSCISQHLPCVQPLPPDQEESTCRWQCSRRLMAQLGFLSIPNWGTLFPIEMSEAFFKDLYKLDDLPDREQYEIALAYVTSDSSIAGYDRIRLVHSYQETSTTMFNKDKEYDDFLKSVGWIVDIPSHCGFLAHHNKDTTSGKALYYATQNMEVFFHVPTLPLGCSTLDKNSSNRDLLGGGNAEVLIVWNRSQQQYRPGTILWETFDLPVPKSQVYLVIDPLHGGLFRVRVCTESSTVFNQPSLDVTYDTHKQSDEVFVGRILGPLQDGCIVGYEWLGRLIRETALNAVRLNRTYQRYQHSIGGLSSAPPRPIQEREDTITEIFHQHVRPVLPGEFYSSLFTNVD